MFRKENGVIMQGGDYYIYDTGTYANLNKSTKTSWRVQIAAIENNKEVADIITTIESVMTECNKSKAVYDLNGRRVVNPTKGIYIQGGKKVLVK